MTEYWFKPKRFGYGATPANWKGWVSSLVVTAILVVLMMTIVVPVTGGRPAWEVFSGIALAAAVIAGFWQFSKVRTDGEWRWRWGNDRK